jgi:uncharacterized membrane protein required for colicin V production
MNSWNGFDFLIFLIFAANTVLGMSRGATKEIISMMCLSVALIFSIKFTIPLAAFFNQSPLINNVVDNSFIQNFMLAIGAGPMTADLLMQTFYSISLLICFVGIFSICEAALTRTGVVEMYSFPYVAIDRKLGGALGCTRGYVISLLVISILTLHLFKANDAMFSNSFFVHLFQNQTIEFDSIISGQQPEQYREILKGKELYKTSDVMKNLQ